MIIGTEIILDGLKLFKLQLTVKPFSLKMTQGNLYTEKLRKAM